MAQFTFRLERLLEFRRTREDEAKKELGVRRLALVEAAAETGRLQAEMEQTAGRWREQAGAQLNLPLLQLTCQYFRLVDERLAHQRELERRSLQRVEEQREAVRCSWRQRRVLEVLREKAQCEHLLAEKLHEYRFLDEAALYAFTRKKPLSP
ncbi:MAG: flagellar export protein FliJ [Bacillota bacterium]